MEIWMSAIFAFINANPDLKKKTKIYNEVTLEISAKEYLSKNANSTVILGAFSHMISLLAYKHN